jgi:hypothetical protein
MTTMIERVARTLCRCSRHDPDARMTERDAVTFDEVGAPFWVAYVETARAVISAMSEPSPEMLDIEVSEISGQDGRTVLAQHYRRMIDAAVVRPASE